METVREALSENEADADDEEGETEDGTDESGI